MPLFRYKLSRVALGTRMHVVEVKRQLFCQSVALTLWFCCLYERSTIILGEMYSDMCCLEDNASWNCQTNTVARLDSLKVLRFSFPVPVVGSSEEFSLAFAAENVKNLPLALCAREKNWARLVGKSRFDLFNRERRCDRWLREDMLKRWVIFTFFVLIVLVPRIYNSSWRNTIGLFWRVSVYRGARKKQFCETYGPFLC